MKPGSASYADPCWQETFKHKVVSAQTAISNVRSGQRVFVGTGCAQPQQLVQCLSQRAHELADVEIVHILTLGTAPYAEKLLSKHFHINSFFIAENVRNTIQEGLGDYTPIFLSDIPQLFRSGRLPLHVALIQVTPPDKEGQCSLGISVDIVKSAAQTAATVIAQVNPQMPRTLGDSFIHTSDIDWLVPVDEPVIEVVPPEPTQTTDLIAEHIAALIEDGATIELGIGQIPHSIVSHLKHKKDLGIHTEMLSDSIVDLVKSGVITGKNKSLDNGKIVASFCLGTRKLYDFIHNNPVFAFHPTEYVNDVFVIGRQTQMIAINVALEIDLTGQVCADSIGTRFFSGIGGQVDFNRGAACSPGGKAIIALPSTAKGGSVSRIVPRISPGGGVVTTRGDVHYVVSEFGSAFLHGKSVQERALALITIAHPKFREALLHEAIETKYVSTEHSDVEGKVFVGPQKYRTTLRLEDGTDVSFRCIHPTDEHRMKDLFYTLSKQTIYYRFMTPMKRLPQKSLQHFVYVDHRNDIAIVATLPNTPTEDIIAVGRYYLDSKTNRAEIALTVADKWQKRGIGRFLFDYLMTIAKQNGIRGFTAEVLADNYPMQHLLENSGCNTTKILKEKVYSFQLDFVMDETSGARPDSAN